MGFGAPHRRDPNAPVKGRDVRIAREISLYDSIFGVVIDAPIKFRDACSVCDGVGGTGVGKECVMCSGTGVIRRQDGPMMMSSTCDACKGRGYFPLIKCTTCEGSGTGTYHSNFKINIPPGFSGGTFSLAEKGGPGKKGGPSGNLYVNVFIRPPEVNPDGVSDEEKRILKKYLG
jgi:molecular chaperone DnaJ